MDRSKTMSYYDKIRKIKIKIVNKINCETVLKFIYYFILPIIIGLPFLNHSTFKFESVTGSNLHSK